MNKIHPLPIAALLVFLFAGHLFSPIPDPIPKKHQDKQKLQISRETARRRAEEMTDILEELLEEDTDPEMAKQVENARDEYLRQAE